MAEMNGDVSRGKPLHLWVVGILALLWNAIGVLNYLMTQTRNETYMAQFSAEQLEFFYSFPSIYFPGLSQREVTGFL